jgi:hypothetical protein
MLDAPSQVFCQTDVVEAILLIESVNAVLASEELSDFVVIEIENLA